MGVRCWGRERPLQSGEQKDRECLMDSIELYDMVATSHVWLLNFKSIKHKLRIQFLGLTNNIPFFFFFKIFYLRDRESNREGQRKKEKETQADSTLSMAPDAGLDPMTLRSQPGPKQRVVSTLPPRRPPHQPHRHLWPWPTTLHSTGRELLCHHRKSWWTSLA